MVNQFLIKKIKVNFTFLHLVSKKNIQLRLSERKKLNRYDKFKMLFYKKVQSGFIKIANKNKTKYLKIDSNLNIITNNLSFDVYPHWSPFGNNITFYTLRDGNWEIYSMNPDGTNQTNITKKTHASKKNNYTGWNTHNNTYKVAGCENIY